MTPFYADDWLTIYAGDCRAVLATMEPESVHCVVTSPPYWGLRDYGTEGQLGLEPTPEQYVENLVAVFREVRRVLRNDGTLWLNLGDSYNGYKGNTGVGQGFGVRKSRDESAYPTPPSGIGIADPSLKQKDLVGIPWRVAFALQADGWYLRSDIIWSKPNPMPESVTDRPTKSHEYLFLLSKSPRYYFDADAVREAHTSHPERIGKAATARGTYLSDGRALGHLQQSERMPEAGRNIRSVWSIPTRPYPGAHFAVFPPKLVEPCIKAGTSERGVCPECGAPWRRVVERNVVALQTNYNGAQVNEQSASDPRHRARWEGGSGKPSRVETTTLGWEQPSCAHTAEEVLEGQYVALPATVLDPFAGSGTVGLVAQNLSRRAVLIDLNPDYLKQQLARNAALPLGLSA